MTTALQRFSTLAALRQALSDRQLSATELAQEALASVRAHDNLNAFVHVDADLTLAQARQADAMLAASRKVGVRLRWGADWDQDGKPRERGETDSPHWELA